jgi:hypothetical protein
MIFKAFANAKPLTEEFVAVDYGAARRHVANLYPELERDHVIEVHGRWPVEVNIEDSHGELWGVWSTSATGAEDEVKHEMTRQGVSHYWARPADADAEVAAILPLGGPLTRLDA